MLILIAMDSENVQEASAVLISELKKWALVNIEGGEIIEIKHFDKREDIDDWVEAVVVINQQENVEVFHEEQIMVLVAPVQRSIDDIVEAYLFRELHELNT